MGNDVTDGFVFNKIITEYFNKLYSSQKALQLSKATWLDRKKIAS